MILFFLLIVIIILIFYYIGKNKRNKNSISELNFNIKEETIMKNENNINSEFIDKDDVIDIIKFKKEKYSRFRNYPNQNSLRKIHRKKPKYLINYVFSNNNIDDQKLSVEKSKYDLISEREELFFNKKPLPETYFKNEIVLIPKNTNTLFTYWEIREDTFEEINYNNNLVSENPIIILKDINGIEKARIYTHSRNSSMYINNVDSNQDYIACLGFLNTNNEFIEIAHSTEANVPNPLPSDNFEVTWGVAETKINEHGNINIYFRTLNESNLHEYLVFKQEILDRELLNDGEKSLNYNSFSSIGSSERFSGSSNIK